MKERSYDFTQKLRRGPSYTKQQIIDSLKRFAKEKGVSSFTEKQYDAWKQRVLCASQIAHRFGGWAKAMERAGFEPKWSPRNNPVHMVELFMDCWEEHDDAPTAKVFADYLKKVGSKLTVHIYNHYFGGLTRLAQRVYDFHMGKISEAQLTEKHCRPDGSRKPISQKLRFEVFTRDSFRCVLCGRSAKADGVGLEVDHKVPVAQGGANDRSNLQTLCVDCNRGKQDALL